MEEETEQLCQFCHRQWDKLSSHMNRLSSVCSLSPLQNNVLLIIDIHIYLKTSEFCVLFLRHQSISKYCLLQIKSKKPYTHCAWSQQTCWEKCTTSYSALRLSTDSPALSEVLDHLVFATRVRKDCSLPWHVTGSIAKVHMCQLFPERQNVPQPFHNHSEHYLHCCIVRLRSTLFII